MFFIILGIYDNGIDVYLVGLYIAKICNKKTYFIYIY
jgi:hypothetical protein